MPDIAPPVAIDDGVPLNPAVQPDQSMSSTFRNWACVASTSVASGAAAIMTMHGAKYGSKSAMMTGFPTLLESSEMADYPVMSTLRNQSEPLIKSAGQSTMDTLHSASEMAADSVRASVRFLGWLFCGMLMVGFSLDGYDLDVGSNHSSRSEGGKCMERSQNARRADYYTSGVN